MIQLALTDVSTIGLSTWRGGHRASAGQKTWRANLNRFERGQQAPRADVLERPLRPTMRARESTTRFNLLDVSRLLQSAV
jgi:hypothetical protein